jgi:hypothetical protein
MYLDKNYNRAEIFVPCKYGMVADPLLSQSTITTIPPATEMTYDMYTVPTGRGDIWGIGIFIGSESLEDIALSSFTLNANGKSMLGGDDNEAMLPYSTFFNNSRNYRVIHLPDQSKITGTLINGGAADIIFVVQYLWYNPYDQIPTN